MTLKYFSAPWCGPCKAFYPVVVQVCEELGIDLEKIDIGENPELAVEYGIKAVPFLHFENEKETKTATGSMSASKLKEFLQ